MVPQALPVADMTGSSSELRPTPHEQPTAEHTIVVSLTLDRYVPSRVRVWLSSQVARASSAVICATSASESPTV